MLTIAASLIADLNSASPRVRRVVTYDLVEDENHHYCTGEDGFNDADGYWVGPSVASVTPASISVDPITRELAIGSVTVTMRGDGVGQALLRNVVIGKVLRLRIGTERTAIADYVTEWVGIIRRPKIRRNGEVVFEADDALGFLADTNITGGWIDHPVEIIRQILNINTPESVWLGDGFDQDTDTTKSHFNLARWEDEPAQGTAGTQLETDGLINVPGNALDLVQGLVHAAGGTLRPASDGQIEFHPYDIDAGAVAHWTRDVWFDLEEIDMLGTIANRVEAKLGRRKATHGSQLLTGLYDQAQGRDRTYSVDDTGSQAAHATADGIIDRIFSLEFDNEWVRGMCRLNSNMTDVATYMEVDHAGMIGFCGSRWRNGFNLSQVSSSSITSNVLTMNLDVSVYGPNILPVGAYIITDGLTTDVTTPTAITSADADTVIVPLVAANGANGSGFIYPQQDPIDTLVSGREAYFMIAETSSDSTIEIVRATGGGGPPQPPGTDIDFVLGTDTPPTEAQKLRSYPGYYGYTVVRGEFGTTAIAHTAASSIVYDITIPVLRAQDILARHAYGAPEMTIRTLLSELAVQIGDFVTIDLAEFRSEALASASADGPVFEVVEKNVDVDSAPPSIEWKLVQVRAET